MDLNALPIQLPPPLAPDATDAQRAVHATLTRAFSELALAVAMVEASKNNLQAMNAPVPIRKPTRAELAWDLYENWPHAREQTEAGVWVVLKKVVDAYAAAYPGSTAD